MNEINDEEEQKSYECLVTRATEYEKSVSVKQNQLMSDSSSCQFCRKYETRESLGHDILLNGKEIMEYLPTLQSKNTFQHVNTLHKGMLVLQNV